MLSNYELTAHPDLLINNFDMITPGILPVDFYDIQIEKDRFGKIISFHFYTRHNAQCDLWQAPEDTDDCKQCSSNSQKPCTEYLCKSLGRCRFAVSDAGIGVCDKLTNITRTPPKAVINEEESDTSLHFGLFELTAGTQTYEGFKIIEQLMP